MPEMWKADSRPPMSGASTLSVLSVRGAESNLSPALKGESGPVLVKRPNFLWAGWVNGMQLEMKLPRIVHPWKPTRTAMRF
jgi:hypothetical protein